MSFFTVGNREQLSLEDSTLPAKTLMNLSYGTNGMQCMDVYLPAGRSTATTKILFLIHGGGWAYGDKTEFTPSIPQLQKKLPNYAFVNINYRLATQSRNHFPTQEEDVLAALQYIINRRHEFALSDKVVLLGASAGGHLALLQAYKYSDSVKPAAVISFFGPVDMADMYHSQTNAYYQYGLQLLIGGTPASKPEIFRQASPINFVTHSNAPTLIFHGGKDALVPVSQSKMLKQSLDKVGVHNELVIYPAEGHGWTGSLLDSSFTKVEEFLTKVVQ